MMKLLKIHHKLAQGGSWQKVEMEIRESLDQEWEPGTVWLWLASWLLCCLCYPDLCCVVMSLSHWSSES